MLSLGLQQYTGFTAIVMNSNTLVLILIYIFQVYIKSHVCQVIMFDEIKKSKKTKQKKNISPYSFKGLLVSDDNKCLTF